MARKRPLAYRVLIRKLKGYGVREQKNRGKGSERLLVRSVGGRTISTPIKCHSEGEEKPIPVIESIRRRLLLDPDHGVTDEEFYS